jgi:Domain of unknown function (DUF4190)
MTNPNQPFGDPGAEPYYPPAYSPPPPPTPPYGYPPPYRAGPAYPGTPPGYRGPPEYPSPYDPYDPYRVPPSGTNGLAIGSLVTSIAGVVPGVPLTLFCYVGLMIPIVGIVLGAVALNQINRTNQQGRGLAISGIAIGGVTLVLLVVLMIVVIGMALSPLSTQ